MLITFQILVIKGNIRFSNVGNIVEKTFNKNYFFSLNIHNFLLRLLD